MCEIQTASNYLSKMKKIFLVLASIVAVCSCDKDKIDSSSVNVEIELSCIDEEPVSYDYDEEKTMHTILCTGKIGGFTGDADIVIKTDDNLIFGRNIIFVAGGSTSFSFTFTANVDSEYNNKPITLYVSVIAVPPSGGSEYVYESSVVIYL